MERLAGLFSLIPFSLLLTVSFFILFALRKVELPGLKAFGYVVAALVWAASVVVFSAGIYTISTGRCPMMARMGAMKGKKMPCMQMKRGPMDEAMKGKRPAMMEHASPGMMPPQDTRE
ncbi:MAG: hypothetical protein KBA46_07440 [Candidatus Omnitrophica bacterium]|nr:hypothetical protein [Candidatus Omnitrophota bacterium]